MARAEIKRKGEEQTEEEVKMRGKRKRGREEERVNAEIQVLELVTCAAGFIHIHLTISNDLEPVSVSGYEATNRPLKAKHEQKLYEALTSPQEVQSHTVIHFRVFELQQDAPCLFSQVLQ